jgi:hypothetical protein
MKHQQTAKCYGVRAFSLVSPCMMARMINAFASKALEITRMVAFALSVFITLTEVAGDFGYISCAKSQPTAITKSQSEALSTYYNAVNQFKSILQQRRAQIDSNHHPHQDEQCISLATT